jgi:hypothetical protein
LVVDEKGGLRMSWKRVLLFGMACAGLVVLPFVALLFYVFHLKGASPNWAALDLRQLDLAAFLTRLGVDLPDLRLDHLLDQAANASQRAEGTGSRGGVTGGTAAGGAAGAGARPEDRLEREKERFKNRTKDEISERVDRIWQEIKDALNMKPLPPESSGGSASGRK